MIQNEAGGSFQDEMETLLLDGLCGEITPLTTDDLQAIRREALAIIKAREEGH